MSRGRNRNGQLTYGQRAREAQASQRYYPPDFSVVRGKEKSNIGFVFCLLIGVPAVFALAMIPYARAQGCTEMTRQWETMGPFVSLGIFVLGAIVLSTLRTGFQPARLPGAAGHAVASIGLVAGFIAMIVVIVGLTFVFQALDVVPAYLRLIGC